jgi:hypothetical protein
MFTSAYDRARALARAALPGKVLGVVAAWPGSSDPKPFGTLKDMGVSTMPAEGSWRGYAYSQDVEDDDVSPCAYRAVRLDWDQADILLWNNLAQEVGVTPQAPVSSKLVDLDRGVVVYAYDDRGMDITALSPDPIAGLYERFDGWLLDHDRPRMAMAFGRGA